MSLLTFMTCSGLNTTFSLPSLLISRYVPHFECFSLFPYEYGTRSGCPLFDRSHLTECLEITCCKSWSNLIRASPYYDLIYAGNWTGKTAGCVQSLVMCTLIQKKREDNWIRNAGSRNKIRPMDRKHPLHMQCKTDVFLTKCSTQWLCRVVCSLVLHFNNNLSPLILRNCSLSRVTHKKITRLYINLKKL